MVYSTVMSVGLVREYEENSSSRNNTEMRNRCAGRFGATRRISKRNPRAESDALYEGETASLLIDFVTSRWVRGIGRFNG